jgi:hypothetical protein
MGLYRLTQLLLYSNEYLFEATCFARGPGSSVGIVTDYGLEGPVGEIFRTRLDRLWVPPILLYRGYRAFPGGKAAGAWCWPPTPS